MEDCGATKVVQEITFAYMGVSLKLKLCISETYENVPFLL